MVYQFARSQLTTVPFTIEHGLASTTAFAGRPAGNPHEDGRVRIVHTAPGKYGKPRKPNGASSFIAAAPRVLTAKPVKSVLRGPHAFASSKEAFVEPAKGPSVALIDFLKQGYTERQLLRPIRY